MVGSHVDPIARRKVLHQIAGTGDYNGDGKPDIVWTNTLTGERTVWLMNGTALSSSLYLANIPAGWSIAATDRLMDAMHVTYERLIHWAFSLRRISCKPSAVQ